MNILDIIIYLFKFIIGLIFAAIILLVSLITFIFTDNKDVWDDLSLFIKVGVIIGLLSYIPLIIFFEQLFL